MALGRKLRCPRGQVAAAFERNAIRLQFGANDPTRLGLVFEGSRHDVALVGEGKRATLYNFFLGNDPSAWRQRVPSYASVFYRGIYHGIDVRMRDDAGHFEYDLIVAPGTDLSRVVIRVEGAQPAEPRRRAPSR